MKLEEIQNSKIVFFGDSITDSLKWFNEKYPYGMGFVNMFASLLHVSYQTINPIIYNEGIGGNKTEDLLERIQKDVLDKNPSIVVLLIGINDVWHPVEANNKPNYDEIFDRLNTIINMIKEKSRLIILTPFLFPTDEFFSSLMPYFIELRKRFLEFINFKNLEYIDIYEKLKIVADTINNQYVTADSVHPTSVGHAIIAQEILYYLYEH